MARSKSTAARKVQQHRCVVPGCTVKTLRACARCGKRICVKHEGRRPRVYSTTYICKDCYQTRDRNVNIAITALLLFTAFVINVIGDNPGYGSAWTHTAVAFIILSALSAFSTSGQI